MRTICCEQRNTGGLECKTVSLTIATFWTGWEEVWGRWISKRRLSLCSWKLLCFPSIAYILGRGWDQGEIPVFRGIYQGLSRSASGMQIYNLHERPEAGTQGLEVGWLIRNCSHQEGAEAHDFVATSLLGINLCLEYLDKLLSPL